jgi:NADP-dependent 3-hydroxy acid dehydrogenase YdfG
VLSGRTIVVTGAARGVGRAIARAYARHHAWARARVFLLTSGALALTGQVLPVNAGFVFT